MKRRMLLPVALLAGLVSVTLALAAEDPKGADTLTQESIEKCKATAATAPTAKLIMEKVDAACKLIEKDGEAAFAKFRGKDSEFLFAGTYIFINTAKDCVTLVHPVNPKLQGRNFSQLRDANGKAFFVEMDTLAQEKGSGWVEYVWPKPGEKEPSPKVTFVKLAKNGDKSYIVGCGVYNLTMEQVKKELEAK